jgi:hypothetical protein
MNHAVCSLVLLSATVAQAAPYRSANFIVEAPTPAVAETIGARAEELRKKLSTAWLGKEFPAWSASCSLEVTVTEGGPFGRSSLTFDRNGQVVSQKIRVEGSLDRILSSVLPHELTHVLFAHHFGRQPPRWADEGGAVLAEHKAIRAAHDQNLFKVLDVPGQRLSLQRLFGAADYPVDGRAFFAQAASVTSFLVNQSDRPTFLAFVAHGMRDGWDQAVKTHYRYRSVEDLEAAWLRQQRTEALARK